MVHPRDFSFQLLPLDSDLFTLDMPEFFRSAFVRADLSLLSTVAKSIFGVETCFGREDGCCPFYIKMFVFNENQYIQDPVPGGRG